MFGGPERRTARDILRSVGGPAVALAIVVGLVIAWRSGVFSKAPAATGDRKGDAKVTTGDAAPPAGKGTNGSAQGSSAAGRFSGGAVSGEVDLADSRAPYDIGETVRVPAGATLRIGPGAALRAAEGAEDVDIRSAGGDLVIEGSPEKPVVVSLPVKVYGARGGLSAKHAVFAGGVSVEGEVACRAERATFMRGLKLVAKGGDGKTEWKFVKCDIRPSDGKAGACLEVDIAAPSDRHKVSITESNLRGGVKGTVGWSSRLDLGGNHWSAPLEDAIGELKADGRLLMEPARSDPVAGAGASADAVDSALPAGERRILVNRDIGFEIAIPEGWRTAGKSMLLAPKSYGHSTKIQVQRRLGVKKAAHMPKLLIVDVRKSKARNVTTGKPAKLQVAGVEGLSFACTFEIGSVTWARRYAIVPAGACVVTITLSARADDAEELAGAFDAAVKNFRFIGSK
jgi:hypothetical protein